MLAERERLYSLDPINERFIDVEQIREQLWRFRQRLGPMPKSFKEHAKFDEPPPLPGLKQEDLIIPHSRRSSTGRESEKRTRLYSDDGTGQPSAKKARRASNPYSAEDSPAEKEFEPCPAEVREEAEKLKHGMKEEAHTPTAERNKKERKVVWKGEKQKHDNKEVEGASASVIQTTGLPSLSHSSETDISGRLDERPSTVMTGTSCQPEISCGNSSELGYYQRRTNEILSGVDCDDLVYDIPAQEDREPMSKKDIRQQQTKELKLIMSGALDSDQEYGFPRTHAVGSEPPESEENNTPRVSGPAPPVLQAASPDLSSKPEARPQSVQPFCYRRKRRGERIRALELGSPNREKADDNYAPTDKRDGDSARQSKGRRRHRSESAARGPDSKRAERLGKSFGQHPASPSLC